MTNFQIDEVPYKAELYFEALNGRDFDEATCRAYGGKLLCTYAFEGHTECFWWFDDGSFLCFAPDRDVDPYDPCGIANMPPDVIRAWAIRVERDIAMYVADVCHRRAQAAKLASETHGVLPLRAIRWVR